MSVCGGGGGVGGGGGGGGGGRDLVYNSRACIVCSLLVGCVFPRGVIGVWGRGGGLGVTMVCCCVHTNIVVFFDCCS
jgi:hypothetical protein